MCTRSNTTMNANIQTSGSTFPLGAARWSRRREVLLRLLPVFPHNHRAFLLALGHFQRFKLLGVLGAFVVGQGLALRKKQHQDAERNGGKKS